MPAELQIVYPWISGETAVTERSAGVRRINRSVGKAIHEYHMISDGDRIAIGLSGGKDSLTLLWILKERLQFIPVQYELVPIYIDPGFDNGFSRPLSDWCKQFDFDLIVEETQNGLLAHSSENRENPCFLCSRLRRQRLFELAEKHHCNKVALGHHKDDLIETLFLNICYAGQICTMLPSQPFFMGRFSLIRPLAYTDESHIAKFAVANRFPTFLNPCPSSGQTRRQEIKSLLQTLYSGNQNVRGNIFRAMKHVNLDYLLKPDNNTSVKLNRHQSLSNMDTDPTNPTDKIDEHSL